MDSAQTREVRAAAAAAARIWREHMRACSQCIIAHHHHGRGGKRPCARGGRLLFQSVMLGEQLAREIALDHEPDPRQLELPLFTEGEPRNDSPKRA